MGFKPMIKYLPAFKISKKKAYKILKERAYGISKEKAYNILAFMGFKPIISHNLISISLNTKKESLCNSGFDGIQTHDKILKTKANEMLKKRACRISKEKAYNIQAFMGFEPMTSKTKHFPVYEMLKEKALKIQAFMGFKQTHGPITKYFLAYDISNKKGFDGIRTHDKIFSSF